MSNGPRDIAIAITTICWFAWLLVWPFGALVNVVGWAIAAIRAWRSGSHRAARWSAAISMVVLFDGYLVLTDQVFAVLAYVPSRWRLLAQMGLLAVALLAGAVGLLRLGLWL